MKDSNSTLLVTASSRALHKIVRDRLTVRSTPDVVKPALSVLAEKRFRAANEEFGKAHQHYRGGSVTRNVSLTASRHFESTIKVMCATHKWPYNSGDTSKAPRLKFVLIIN